MKAVIISDLHLGAKNCQAERLHTFLSDLQTDWLILNGDILDSLHVHRLQRRCWRVLRLLRRLAKRVQIVWVVGNHDEGAEPIARLLGIKWVKEFTLRSGDRRILILHGHQFDTFITAHPVLTWLGDIGYNFLQWLDRSHCLARWAKRGSKKFQHCLDRIRCKALVYAERRKCTDVCCGHTHWLEAKASYYNSGCWTETPCTWLEVVDGEITCHSLGANAEATF